jgi:hypothetical protein
MALSQELVQPEVVRDTDAAPGRTEDGRKARRFPLVAAVRIGWVDGRRQMTYRTARGVDISETGLALRIPAPLAPSTLVHLELAACGISAVGHVRYCVPIGAEWRAGIEVAASFPSGVADSIEFQPK